MSLFLHRQQRIGAMTHQTETENQDEKCLTDKKDNGGDTSGKNYGGIVISI